MTELKIRPLQRRFKVGMQLIDDPMPTGDLDTVVRILAASHPDITTARMEGPKIEGDYQVWTFAESIGTKG